MLLSLCFTFLSFKLSCFFFLYHFLNKNLLSFSLCLIPSQTSHVEHLHFRCEKCTLALLFLLHSISFIHLSKQYVLVFSLSHCLYFFPETCTLRIIYLLLRHRARKPSTDRTSESAKC